MPIRVLPNELIDQIAAGEVIERPASVVKELVENSLDAGANRIEIDIERGGTVLVRVRDDGRGIDAQELPLALARHATSKITSLQDLEAVTTLGFRGEALPSIASVARVLLETRSQDEPGGTLLEIAGGKILRVEEAGLPQGTSVAVRDLFFNTPARKKFLKAESTELSHIASLVTHFDGGAGRVRGGTGCSVRTAIDRDLRSPIGGAAARHDAQPRDRADGGQRLTAEAERRHRFEILERGDFARGVPRER